MSAARSCRCGAQRAEPVIGAGQKFCEECGAALGAAPPATAAPVANATVTPPSATELRVASVLFVDLVDFTSLAESRDAEDVRELLSGYFDAARTIVERYGGAIEKFIGDAVMAVWGVPGPVRTTPSARFEPRSRSSMR